MKEIIPILTQHNVNLKQLKFYEKQMPEQRKALNMAVREILLLPGMSIAKLARHLEVDRGKIYRVFYGFDVDMLPQRWSEYEETQLRKLHKKKTAAELSEMLSRSKSSVIRRISSLGLNKGHKKKTAKPIPRQPQTDQSFPF